MRHRIRALYSDYTVVIDMTTRNRLSLPVNRRHVNWTLLTMAGALTIFTAVLGYVAFTVAPVLVAVGVMALTALLIISLPWH